jgi:large subunit ribosomal protein L9
VIEAKAGDQGRLFGSVTASDIAELVSAHVGSKLEHRQVALGTPIKEVGTYEVSVSLTRNVKAQLTVLVKGEGQEEVPAKASAADDDGDDSEDGDSEDEDEDGDEDKG